MATTTTTAKQASPVSSANTREATLELNASPAEVLGFLRSYKIFIHSRFDAYPRVDANLNEQGIFIVSDLVVVWPSAWKVVIQDTSHGITVDAKARLFPLGVHEEWTVFDLASGGTTSNKAQVKVVSTVKAPGFLYRTVTKALEKGENRIRKRWIAQRHGHAQQVNDGANGQQQEQAAAAAQ